MLRLRALPRRSRPLILRASVLPLLGATLLVTGCSGYQIALQPTPTTPAGPLNVRQIPGRADPNAAAFTSAPEPSVAPAVDPAALVSEVASADAPARVAATTATQSTNAEAPRAANSSAPATSAPASGPAAAPANASQPPAARTAAPAASPAPAATSAGQAIPAAQPFTAQPESTATARPATAVTSAPPAASRTPVRPPFEGPPPAAAAPAPTTTPAAAAPTRTATPVPTASPPSGPVRVNLVGGVNTFTYVGPSLPVNQALASVLNKVEIVYFASASGETVAWKPGEAAPVLAENTPIRVGMKPATDVTLVMYAR